MKFKVDENLPIEVAELLRQTGYDATTVLEQDLGGSADTHLASLCQEERRIFVTLDTDFGDIRAYPPKQFLWTDRVAPETPRQALCPADFYASDTYIFN
jgi:predicted nuclease of predicted toxin-antitoxin system